MEQAILNLTKLVGDFVEGQKTFNAQLSQRIHTVENSLDQKLDGLQSGIDQQFDNLQSGIDHKFDSLQKSISRLAKQHDHQEEGNPERECLIDIILGEQTQLQQLLQEELMQELVEAPEELPAREAGGGRGKEVGEEPQNLILQPIPINLNLSATAQPKNSPLTVHILPSPASQSQHKTPATEAKAIPPLVPIQYFKKLVAFVQTFATTSKKLAVAHTAWHSGWFGCWFKHGAPGPRHFHKLHQFQ